MSDTIKPIWSCIYMYIHISVRQMGCREGVSGYKVEQRVRSMIVSWNMALGKTLRYAQKVMNCRIPTIVSRFWYTFNAGVPNHHVDYHLATWWIVLLANFCKHMLHFFSWYTWRKHGEVVEYLLQHNAETNLSDQAGWTPLHSAAFNGYSDILIRLLGAGSDVTMQVLRGSWS